MKISIYGDSFGSINTRWDHPRFAEVTRHLGDSWVDIIEQSHSITNYAVSGSAFLHGYELFTRHHTEADLNIFLISSPYRTYVKALDGILMFGPEWLDSEYRRVKAAPDYPRKYDHLDIMDSLKVYFELWADWQTITMVQQAVVGNIPNISNNTIIVPCFDNSIANASYNLNDLANYELSLIDPIRYAAFDFSKLHCRRKCHFSRENNMVMASAFLAAIDSGQKTLSVNKSDILTPVGHPFDFYISDHIAY